VISVASDCAQAAFLCDGERVLGPGVFGEKCGARLPKWTRRKLWFFVGGTAERRVAAAGQHKLFSEGKNLGWFLGRAGKRAPVRWETGDIVADPRRPEDERDFEPAHQASEIFRPFAPSILAEETGPYLLSRIQRRL